jgi:hypothetical protein
MKMQDLTTSTDNKNLNNNKATAEVQVVKRKVNKVNASMSGIASPKFVQNAPSNSIGVKNNQPEASKTTSTIKTSKHTIASSINRKSVQQSFASPQVSKTTKRPANVTPLKTD